MIIKSAINQPARGSYEPRPQTTLVDYMALGQLAIKRFPKVRAVLAK
ncbi:hypothetical protein [Agrobacterium vitis]|uniref:Uncharacterized protein n=1 Tax=Agrobacterium vitis TaxID=373 RepID=A0AAE2UY80_AGRVI|nr:hypothetical protein [Agrobacterium vitis]MBF2716899.1 hypothetical protein [Agrobacterium vitis]